MCELWMQFIKTNLNFRLIYAFFVDKHAFMCYNIIKGKEVDAMGKKQKKKPKRAKLDWQEKLIDALIDFFIGFLLLVVDRQMK